MTTPEIVLKVGKKGEIFTNAKLRKRLGIKLDGRVKAEVFGNKLIIEAIPSIEEVLKRKPVMASTSKKIEIISEEMQKEEEVYG